MNMLEWKNEVISSNIRKAMPVMTYPGMEMIGTNVYDMVTDGMVQYKCIKALYEKYPDILATSMIMDLSVEAEAFGSSIKFSRDEIPTVISRMIDSFDKLDDIRIPNVGDGRTSQQLMAARMAAENLTDRPVFGCIIGPYSLAGRLFDISEFMTAIYLEPEGCHFLLNACTQFLKNYARAFKDIGVNGIIIAEPAAGLLAWEQCDEFSSAYVKEIVDYVQDENFFVILHNCGNTLSLVDSMVSTGSMGFHFGNAVDMTEILPKVPSDRLVFGNIDPAGVFKNSSQEDIILKTMDLLNRCSSYKNFILSSGCDIPPGTPMKNIDAFMKALKQFNHNIVNL